MMSPASRLWSRQGESVIAAGVGAEFDDFGNEAPTCLVIPKVPSVSMTSAAQRDTFGGNIVPPPPPPPPT